MSWHRVDVPPRGRQRGFVCGLEVDGGRVVKAAPIMRWAIAKPLRDVRLWVHRAGGDIRPLDAR